MFRPWIGDRYGKADNLFGGKRVLVVGESHHAGEHAIGTVVPEMTNDVMRKYGSGVRKPHEDRWMRTLDNVAWAVSGKDRRDLQQNGKRGEFGVWNSMAFYNYIPVVLAGSARAERPSRDQFTAGLEPFERVLADLTPQLLLVCGYQLFPWVIRNHDPDNPENPWAFKGRWIEMKRANPLRAMRMLHPSAAFSPTHWHKVIVQALDEPG